MFENHLSRLVFLTESVVGWIVSPSKVCSSLNTWHLWMWPSMEKKVFADVIRLQWGSSGLWWALNQMTGVSIKERGEGLDTDTQKKDTEENCMWWWRQRLEWYSYKPRHGRFFLRASRRSQVCQHLHFRLPGSWTVREYSYFKPPSL